MKNEELLELAKKLANEEDLSKFGKELAELDDAANKFARIDANSWNEQKIIDQFNEYYVQIKERKVAVNDAINAKKKELIEKVKVLVKENNFNKALKEYDELFNQFKGLGRSAKELDDQYYQTLKEVKNTIYENRKAYFEGQKAKAEAAKKAKEDIVAAAKELLNESSFKVADAKMNELFNSWKQAGFAGKELDDALWAEFAAARKEFNAKKNAYFEEQKKVFEEKAVKKQEIIKKAKVLLANSEFTEEEINSIKDLRQAWKEVGFAGKENDDALWNEFNAIINKYFEEKKFYKGK